ncbi:Lrp/AsnC family transcriptional regulator [Paracoccus sp. Z118]|uniref:Lrp/AsnC family transcriptional regulator n=1 Tax=Paracoccus sp. Z118 TaxID=2851017 RepID=UPI001C2C8CEE|nr:Lrp/AsnC family transcriptional regulator [Paracoccus sp. Z118]MBV0891073.1 Lrp/AsnC family transcriptional regulator [Paracoccus sp. Z118]
MTLADLDSFDVALLIALQRDGAMTAAALSQVVNLSPSQCARRRAALEASGVIQGYNARLNPIALGLGLRAMVRINLRRDGPDSDEEFMRFVDGLPQVESAFSVAGDADYVLDVRFRDMESFGSFVHETLLSHPRVSQVRADVVMRTLKDRAALDLRGNGR